MLEIFDEDMEWEILQKPLTIEKITPSTDIPKKSVRLVVKRNDSYRIIVNLTAIDKQAALGMRDIDKYSPVEPFTVEGYDHNNSKIRLKNCYISRRSSIQTPIEGTDFEITLEIIPKDVVIEMKNNSEVSRLSEWYLNGPYDEFGSIVFPRETARYRDNGSNQIIRKRSTIDISEEESLKVTTLNPGTESPDFAFIESESIKFIIAKVPSNFVPNWSKNMCIEYRADFGPIPDFKQRESICEIVSFVLGTQLMRIGFTEYDQNDRILRSVAENLWGGPYTRFICENRRASPFDLGIKGYIKNIKIMEEILSDLVPKYLALRDKFNLKYALERYWISRNMPIGTNLPVLSSALEVIMKNWFDSESSQSKALYIPKKEFDKILEEDFKSIENKLDNYIKQKNESLDLEEKEATIKKEIIELKGPIMGKIRNSYQISLTKQYLFFFKEIGLQTGKNEEKVLLCRHSMAHPGKVNYEEYKKMRKCTLAYETLFHRVFLKILGYTKNYVDRSQLIDLGIEKRYFEKDIDMPLGGSL